MNLILIHLAIFIVTSICIYNLFIRAQQKEMLGRAYSVRNRLIELVGEEKLSEDNPVFDYYYNHINDLLSQSPDIIGFEDIVEIIIKNKNNEDFELAIKESKRKIEELSEMDEMKDDEIRMVAEDYFKSVGGVILSHSSILKLLYLLANIFSKYVAISTLVALEGFGNTFMRTYINAIKTLLIFDKEYQSLEAIEHKSNLYY